MTKAPPEAVRLIVGHGLSLSGQLETRLEGYLALLLEAEALLSFFR